MSAINWAEVESAFATLPLPQQLEMVERLIGVARKQPAVSVEAQKRAWRRVLEKTADLPVANPQDGLSGRDHDQILYGKDGAR